MLATAWAALLAPAFTAFGSPVSWLELVAFVLRPSQRSLNGSTLDVNGGSYIR